MGKNYVIGDVQGCYRSLQALLNLLGFSQEDHIWFVGDLVNRGNQSKEVLGLIFQNQANMHTVLGNHDLHLLRRYFLKTEPKLGDTLETNLLSPDNGQLIEWLASQPFIIEQEHFLIVHAGIYPLWSLQKIREIATQYNGVMGTFEGRRRYLPKNQTPPEISSLVTMRAVDESGAAVDFKGNPANLAQGTYPWFLHPRRHQLGKIVFFGHWSALGYYESDSVVCLDSGCVWGGPLTAYCIEEKKIYSVPTQEIAIKSFTSLE